MARGDGLAVVAAAPPADADGPTDSVGAGHRWRPSADRGGRSILRSGRGRAGGHRPPQHRRGVPEQRASDAAVAPPPDDAADARPEATVLELPTISLRPERRHRPLPGVGAGVAHVRLPGPAPVRPQEVGARTVNL